MGLILSLAKVFCGFADKELTVLVAKSGSLVPTVVKLFFITILAFAAQSCGGQQPNEGPHLSGNTSGPSGGLTARYGLSDSFRSVAMSMRQARLPLEQQVALISHGAMISTILRQIDADVLQRMSPTQLFSFLQSRGFPLYDLARRVLHVPPYWRPLWPQHLDPDNLMAASLALHWYLETLKLPQARGERGAASTADFAVTQFMAKYVAFERGDQNSILRGQRVYRRRSSHLNFSELGEVRQYGIDVKFSWDKRPQQLLPNPEATHILLGFYGPEGGKLWWKHESAGLGSLRSLLSHSASFMRYRFSGRKDEGFRESTGERIALELDQRILGQYRVPSFAAYYHQELAKHQGRKLHGMEWYLRRHHEQYLSGIGFNDYIRNVDYSGALGDESHLIVPTYNQRPLWRWDIGRMVAQ